MKALPLRGGRGAGRQRPLRRAGIVACFGKYQCLSLRRIRRCACGRIGAAAASAAGHHGRIRPAATYRSRRSARFAGLEDMLERVPQRKKVGWSWDEILEAGKQFRVHEIDTA